MRHTLIISIFFTMFCQTAFANEPEECLHVAIAEFQESYDIEIRNPLLKRGKETDRFFFPVHIDASDNSDVFTYLEVLQDAVSQCGFGVFVGSVRTLMDNLDSSSRSIGVSYYIEPLPVFEESDESYQDFIAVASYFVNLGYFRGLGFHDLLPYYNQDEMYDGEFHWRFQFGRIREDCPIIWERHREVSALREIHLLRNGRRVPYTIVSVVVERHFMDMMPEVSVSNNTNRDTCALSIWGRPTGEIP